MQPICNMNAETLALELSHSDHITGSDPYMTNCPLGHNHKNGDEHPSCQVGSHPDGSLWCKCYGGCNQQDIYEEIKRKGISLNGTRKSSNGQFKPWEEEPVAIFPYCDKHGRLLYQKRRYLDKDNQRHFVYWHKDGKGGWSRGGGSVPYRLSEVAEAASEGKSILFVEGETDSDCVYEGGCITATTLDSGANSLWSNVDLNDLNGVSAIYFCADNDKPGYGYANRGCRYLTEKGFKCYWIQLPGIDDLSPGSDVRDWINSGHTWNEFEEARKTATHWTKEITFPGEESESESHNSQNRLNSGQFARAENFGDPVPFGRLETPPISSEFLPDWIRAEVEGLAVLTQTPQALGILFVLSVLAACIQKRFEISPKDGYSEPLALWTITILPTGNRKSAVVDQLIEPINEWEREAALELAGEKVRIDTEIEISTRRIAELSRRASKADDHDLKMTLAAEIEDIRRKLPTAISNPAIYSTDATPEGLRNELAANHSRTSVLADEGGIFETLGGLYHDGKATNLDVVLQGYSGGNLRVVRKDSHVYLEKIAVSFGLTVQPEVVASFNKGGKQVFRGKGVLGRFLFAVPKSNIGSRNVRSSFAINPDVRFNYHEGIRKLLNIKPVIDKWGKETPRELKPNSAALELWYSFSQDIEDQQGEGGRLERIADWTAKLPGQALRVAGLCHVAKHAGALSALSALSPQGEIEETTMAGAIEFCRNLISHAEAAFDLMDVDPAIADAKWIFKQLKTLVHQNDSGYFIKRHEVHCLPKFKKSKGERITKALDILRERNILTSEQKIPTQKPTLVHYINPAILENSFSEDKADKADKAPIDLLSC